MSQKDKRIREFAYQIWESEGRPDGQQERHWEMARILAEADAVTVPATPRKTRAKTAGSAATDKPAAQPSASKKPRAARKPLAP